MSLNSLFRNAKKAAALKNAAMTATLVAGVAGFTMMSKSVDSNGNVIESSTGSTTSSGTNNTGASGFATSNPVIKPTPGSSSSSSGSGSFDISACVKNPSADACSGDSEISQKEWDQFLPPEGIVVRDARGNVVFKKCRSLTEGAAAAKKEMEPEKARFDKLMTAMNINTGTGQYSNFHNDEGSGIYNSTCASKPTKVAPKEEPCPTYQNYTDLKNYYREQYYLITNELQRKTAANYEDCFEFRNNIMAAVDPNWKNDPGITVKTKSAAARSVNGGVR